MTELNNISTNKALPILNIARFVAILVAIVTTFLFLAPLIVLLVKLSPSSVSLAFSSPGAFGPTVISLSSAAVALVVVVIIGTPLAWAMTKDLLPAKRLFELALTLPLLTPPLVIGLLLVFMIGPLSFVGKMLGQIHLSATNTFLALVIAEVYECAPYYILGAVAAFSAVDTNIEQAAALLGETPLGVALHISLPLASPGLASALSMGWARAVGAFGAVIIIAYHPYGLPMQIWTTLEETGLSSALPFALILLLVALPLPIAAYTWGSRASSKF